MMSPDLDLTPDAGLGRTMPVPSTLISATWSMVAKPLTCPLPLPRASAYVPESSQIVVPAHASRPHAD